MAAVIISSSEINVPVQIEEVPSSESTLIIMTDEASLDPDWTKDSVSNQVMWKSTESPSVPQSVLEDLWTESATND